MSFIPRSRFGLVRINCTYPSLVAKKVTRKKKVSKKPAEPERLEGLEHPVPGTFGEILGQERAVEQIERALEAGRMHHAWIFHGPRGVGKFTTALAFAALALDETTGRDLSGNLSVDPESRAQTLLKARSHPDLHVITKELARFSEDAKVRSAKLATIPKDVVEQHLLRPSALAAKITPGGAASKVFIVDEAELLDRSATNAAVQNAMLKTLEEPAPGTLIILVTSSEERLLPTIRSRCQRVRFGTLSRDAMETWLTRQDYSPAEQDWARRFGEGSPGRVKEAIETGLIAWHERIGGMLERLLAGQYPLELGASMASMVDEWASARVAADARQSKEAGNKAGADRMLSLVGEILRMKLAEASASGDERTLEQYALRIDALERARGRLFANVPGQMVFEALAAELAQPSMLSGV